MTSGNAAFRDGVPAGVLWGPLELAFALALALVTILVVAWAIDGVFVCKVWPDGVERLRSGVAAELGRGSELAARQGGAPGIIAGTTNFRCALVFRATAAATWACASRIDFPLRGQIRRVAHPHTSGRRSLLAPRARVDRTT